MRRALGRSTLRFVTPEQSYITPWKLARLVTAYIRAVAVYNTGRVIVDRSNGRPRTLKLERSSERNTRRNNRGASCDTLPGDRRAVGLPVTMLSEAVAAVAAVAVALAVVVVAGWLRDRVSRVAVVLLDVCRA